MRGCGADPHMHSCSRASRKKRVSSSETGTYRRDGSPTVSIVSLVSVSCRVISICASLRPFPHSSPVSLGMINHLVDDKSSRG